MSTVFFPTEPYCSVSIFRRVRLTYNVFSARIIPQSFWIGFAFWHVWYNQFFFCREEYELLEAVQARLAVHHLTAPVLGNDHNEFRNRENPVRTMKWIKSKFDIQCFSILMISIKSIVKSFTTLITWLQVYCSMLVCFPYNVTSFYLKFLSVV